MEWQLIDTAPRDSTDILGFDSVTNTFHVTFWDSYRWHDPDDHYYSEAPSFYPTHWMPLPEPPNNKQPETDSPAQS